MYYVLCIICYVLCVMCYVLCYVSCVMCYVVYYVLCVTCYASCVMLCGMFFLFLLSQAHNTTIRVNLRAQASLCLVETILLRRPAAWEEEEATCCAGGGGRSYLAETAFLHWKPTGGDARCRVRIPNNKT